MAGNSWLGVAQYWAAIEQPPHLKCIAPWEGLSDLYRDLSRRGGIPWAPFVKWVLLGVPGLFCVTDRGDIPMLTENHRARPAGSRHRDGRSA